MLEYLLRPTVPFAVSPKSHSRQVARGGLLVFGHVRSHSSFGSFRTWPSLDVLRSPFVNSVRARRDFVR